MNAHGFCSDCGYSGTILGRRTTVKNGFRAFWAFASVRTSSGYRSNTSARTILVSARTVAILERFWAVARLSKMVFVHFGLLRLFVLAAAIEATRQRERSWFPLGLWLLWNDFGPSHDCQKWFSCIWAFASVRHSSGYRNNTSARTIMVSARNVAILERFWAVARLSKMVFVHFGLLRLFVLAAAIEATRQRERFWFPLGLWLFWNDFGPSHDCQKWFSCIWAFASVRHSSGYRNNTSVRTIMVSARNVASLERFWAVARLSKMVFVHFGLFASVRTSSGCRSNTSARTILVSARTVAILERFWAVARLSKMVFVHLGFCVCSS